MRYQVGFSSLKRNGLQMDRLKRLRSVCRRVCQALDCRWSIFVSNRIRSIASCLAASFGS